MHSGICILPLVKAHAKAITALEQLLFADEPWSEAVILDEVANRFTKSFVALEEDRVVGYLLGSCVCGCAALNRIAILPAYRGKGIADALMTRFSDALRDDHAEQCALEVRASNTAALRLYEKHGFCAVGVRERFYKHPIEDATLMVKRFKNREERRGSH